MVPLLQGLWKKSTACSSVRCRKRRLWCRQLEWDRAGQFLAENLEDEPELKKMKEVTLFHNQRETVCLILTKEYEMFKELKGYKCVK